MTEFIEPDFISQKQVFNKPEPVYTKKKPETAEPEKDNVVIDIPKENTPAEKFSLKDSVLSFVKDHIVIIVVIVVILIIMLIVIILRKKKRKQNTSDKPKNLEPPRKTEKPTQKTEKPTQKKEIPQNKKENSQNQKTAEHEELIDMLDDDELQEYQNLNMSSNLETIPEAANEEEELETRSNLGKNPEKENIDETEKDVKEEKENVKENVKENETKKFEQVKENISSETQDLPIVEEVNDSDEEIPQNSDDVLEDFDI